MVDAVGSLLKLQRTILTWDYYSLAAKAEEGGGPFDNLRRVPNTFTDIRDYKAVFEPLLLEECCAQIMRGVEEGEVLTPHPTVVATSEQKDDFLYARLVLSPEASQHYSDNDLVLLCKDRPMDESTGTWAQAQDIHALGYCEGHEGEQSVRVKFYLTDESQLGNPQQLNRVRAMRVRLQSPESGWFLLKLSAMSTIVREWVALQAADVCPFADIMVGCQPRSAPSSRHMDIPPGMKATMEAQCNDSQMEALQAGLDGTPLVLIQGPPGTGKTRTILNLLSVVMHAAAKGSLELMRAPRGEGAASVKAAELGEEDRHNLWLAQSPWAAGGMSALEEVTPHDPEPTSSASLNNSAADAHGLTATRPVMRVGKDSGPKAHVLVCAPSNSALDEIVLRILKTGLMDKDGNMYAPSIVRIGVNAHHSVKAVALDAIVDARMGGGGEGGGKGSMSRIERDRMRLAILEEASIVCSTLSFAGSPMLYRLSRKFDVVVIDEAAQAVEPSVLVPLVMGCKQAYLVGDPVQLPATVISNRARDHGYDCSLFKRLQVSGYPVRMLNTQYRMHPDISVFPSRQFYGGGLLNGESVIRDTQSPWHAQRCFGPLAFFDVTGKETIPPSGASIQNKTEANMVLCLYRELAHRYPSLRRSASVAVISPYKAQVKLLRDAFSAALGEEAAKLVDVNTIDGFQGREKDIVIFSCVRSLRKGSKGIGFVADERRINVGLTRARCSLLVVGNARALQGNGHWAALIHDCLEKGCLYRPKNPFADWVTQAGAGEAQPVAPTPEELAVLDKARSRLAKAHSAAQAAPGKGVDAVVGPNREGEGMGDGDDELAEELHEDDMNGEDEGEIGKLADERSKAKAAAKAAAAAAEGPDNKKEAGGPAAKRRRR